jgi:uncharacterized protein (TIRG00374 family)
LIEKIKRNLYIVFGLAILLYLIFAIFTNINDLASTLKSFNWFYLPLLLLFSYLNYLSRFVKWHYYVKLLKINTSMKLSFSIFMSGLAMSLTPGKMGEVLKSYMLKQTSGESISKTAPIVFIERVTDFLSLVLLSLIGAIYFNFGIISTLIVGIFFIILVLIISNKEISFKLIDILQKIKIIKKQAKKLHDAYESSYKMLQFKPLTYMVLVSFIAWFFECLGFYFVLHNFDKNILFILPIFVYSFSTIIGSVTMLPGGLGATEGSLTYLLHINGFSKEEALASTFIIRTVTLWFALAIGVIHLFYFQKKYGDISIDKQE